MYAKLAGGVSVDVHYEWRIQRTPDPEIRWFDGFERLEM